MRKIGWRLKRGKRDLRLRRRRLLASWESGLRWGDVRLGLGVVYSSRRRRRRRERERREQGLENAACRIASALGFASAAGGDGIS